MKFEGFVFEWPRVAQAALHIMGGKIQYSKEHIFI